MLELILPYPPSVNSYLKTATRSTRYISKKGLAFRAAVRVAVPRDIKPMEQRLMVSVVLYPPDKRRRDIDNPIKLLLDSLQRANVYVDDSQIDRLLIERGTQIKAGICRVIIMPYEKK